MRAKEIILLIFIILAGVTFYHARTGKLDDIGFFIDDYIIFSSNEFIYEDFQEIEPPFPPHFQIINAHGDIEINGTDEEKITITFRKNIRRRNEEKAKEISGIIKMIIHKNTNQVTLSTNRDKLRRKNYETHFKVFLPKSMDIKVKNSYGTVKTSNVGNTDITNRHGKVIASDIHGELILKNSYRDVEVKNVRSDLHLESKHSTIFVSYIKGTAQISNGYGKIHMENISQAVKVDGPHTEIFGQNLAGPVEIENSYEKITLYEVGPTKIIGHHSKVEVHGAKGYLDIKDKYSKIEVNNIRGNFLVDGKNLDVVGKTIIGQEISIVSSYRNVKLSEFSGRTTISLSHGDVVLEPSPLTHPIEVKGKYANIRLSWPLQGPYPFEARAKNGDIKWGLPDELSLEEENGVSTIKAFLQEKDKPSILLSTSYGTIRIED
jgi:hypothetical protein